MGHYVDGFVIPVPKANTAAYKRMARTAAKVWREHGALLYVESVADDVDVGKRTSFPQAVTKRQHRTCGSSARTPNLTARGGQSLTPVYTHNYLIRKKIL